MTAKKSADAGAEPAPKRRGGPTSSEVARRAGVSRTTVSFVLNGVTDQGIAETTRERVLAAAQALGYEPNAAARSLAGGRTGTIGLVLPRGEHLCVDAFLAQLIASVNDQCHRHGLKLLIESTEEEGREPGAFVQLVRSRRIDGLIVAHLRTSEMAHLERLHDSGIPLVVLGGQLPGPGHRFSTVGDDTWDSAQRVVNHLIGLGHAQIALVNYAPPEFHHARQRERGWREALRAHGIAVDERLCVHADFSAASGYQVAVRLLATGAPFSALFAGNDTVAFGVLQALREAGRRVPQDVAVVGYDDIPLAPFAQPPLTSVRSDPIGHGRKAVEMLLAQMAGRPLAEIAPLPPAELVVRRSCGAP